MSNQLLLRRRTTAAVKRPNYLKFTALEDGCTLALNKVGNPTNHPTEYSLNKGLFVPYVFGTVLTFNEGDTIEWRRAIGYESNDFSFYSTSYYTFITSGNIYQDGMVTTLLKKDGNVQSIANLSFVYLIKSASGFVGSLNLPDSLVSIGNYAFVGCNGFSNALVIPSSVTVIGDYAFQNCSSLTGDLIIPYGVSSINKSFEGCSGLNGILSLPDTLQSLTGAFKSCISLNGYVTLPASIKLIDGETFAYCTGLKIADMILPLAALGSVDIIFSGWQESQFDGEGTTFLIKGSLNVYGTAVFFCFENVIIGGSLKNRAERKNKYLKVLRIGGNFGPAAYASGGKNGLFNVYGTTVEFTELLGIQDPGMTNRTVLKGTQTTLCNIVHLGYNGIAGDTGFLPASRMGTIYVGDGSSDANDQAVLDAYLADADWSQYSSKLAKWFDYHGQYRTYKVTDSLTNCINSNPVVFPFITRGDAYECVISADDGYTLQSVAVTMMDTDSTSQTYGQQIDITSSVYDASTGTISISSVTGNIEITANAN